MLIEAGEKPKYLQLVEHIRQQIVSGELGPGERLPSYAKMCKQYGVTQPTVTRCQEILEKEGYIERVWRKGTFVSLSFADKVETASGNIVQKSVVVLAGGAMVNWPTHQQTGWGEYIALGAINELRLCSRNVISVENCNLGKSDVKYLLQNLPAGVIIIGEPVTEGLMLETAQQLQKAGVPVVVYGNSPELRQFDRVISDHEQGNYELTRWLIEQGCRRILQIHPEGGEESYWLKMRNQGYQRAMREAALWPLTSCFRSLWVSPEDDRDSFDNAARIIAKHLAPYLNLTKAEGIQALMAVTDGEVYVLAAACRLLGKEPNKDVLLVGYDHYWEDSLERKHETVDPLATVDKRNPELGAALVQLLNERINGQLPENTPQCRVLTPRLIVS